MCAIPSTEDVIKSVGAPYVRSLINVSHTYTWAIAFEWLKVIFTPKFGYFYQIKANETLVPQLIQLIYAFRFWLSFVNYGSLFQFEILLII